MDVMRSRGFWRALLAGALVLAAAAAAGAQTVTGTIQGTVVDTNGGVLPGVTILVKHVETGAERTVVTNESGIYSAPYVPIGRYTITATLAGFGPVTRAGITVGLNDTRVVDFKLDPRLSDSVTVTADAPQINTTNAEVKGSLTSEQIMDKPTANAGSFLSLAETFTGFQENPTSGQNNPTASSGSSINFNGTGTRGATFQINGVNNDDSSENQNRQGAALSTIQEFQVLKNGYSAEFGRGDGAVVLVQTKSGTNQFHGDAYWYKQDNKWNAKSFFSPTTPKPVRQRTQYGFTVGFPIITDKLLGVRQRGPHVARRREQLRARPDPGKRRRERHGSSAATTRPPTARGSSRSSTGSPRRSRRTIRRSNRTYAGLQGINWPDEDYSGRLDWNIKDGSMVTGRYQWTHQLRETEDIIDGENAKQDNEQQNLGVTWTHVFGSSLVAEARYGLGLRSTNVNIAAGNDTPIIRFTASPVSGSIIGNAGNFPINRDQTDHQFVYNMTAQVFRTHSVKAGTDVRRQALDDTADNFSRGFWTFNRICGGVTYATPYEAFFDGCVQRYEKDYGPFFLENRMNEANVYAQDDWRLRDGLTLNLGLRYEYVAAPKEIKDRIDYVYGADTDNIEPRIGFAYTPKWDTGLPAHAERRDGQPLDPRRLGHLRRAHLPVGLLAGRRQRPVQSPERAGPRRQRPAQSLGSVERVRLRSRRADRESLDHAAGREPRDAVDDEVDALGGAIDAVRLDASHQLRGQPQLEAAQVRPRQPAAVAARRPRAGRGPSLQRTGGRLP